MGRVRNGRTVFREGDDGKAGATLELFLDQLANGGPDLRLLVERRVPVAHDLLQGGLVMDAKTVRPDLADEEPPRLQRPRGTVDARGLDLGLAEGGDALVAGQLAGEIDPRGLASFRRVPGIAHEDPDPGIGCFGKAGRGQQVGHARQRPGPNACAGKMVERGQGVGLSSAELGDEGEHRGGVLRPPGKAPKHHAHRSSRARVKQVREKNCDGSR